MVINIPLLLVLVESDVIERPTRHKLSSKILPFQLIFLFHLQKLVDYYLLNGHIMIHWAFENIMILAMTNRTLMNFISSQNEIILIPQLTEKLIIHLADFEAVHELLVGEVVKHAIKPRFNVK